jgi:hypothetical protein
VAQDFGAETLCKNFRPARRGLVEFFQIVYNQKINVGWTFQFRFSG